MSKSCNLLVLGACCHCSASSPRRLGAGLAAMMVLSACAPAPAGTATVRQPTKATTPALTHDGGVAYATQIPKQISLRLPAPIIAQGAGNFHTLAASSTVSLANALHDQMGVYLGMTQLVNTILGAIAANHLPADTPATFPDDDNPALTAEQKALPENQLTANLTTAADHAVVAIYQGAKVDPAHQLCGISYTSQTKGVAVFRPTRNNPDGSHGIMASTFDLDAGKVSADAYFTQGDTAAWRVHLEFQRVDQPAAGAPTFTLRTSAYGTPNGPANAGLNEISVNCLGDTGAAGIVGVIPKQYKDQLKGQVAFARNDGLDPDPNNAGPHDLYVGADGKDLLPAQASAALKAIVPADTDLQRPFMVDPQDPANGDPAADAAFKFPAIREAKSAGGARPSSSWKRRSHSARCARARCGSPPST